MTIFLLTADMLHSYTTCPRLFKHQYIDNAIPEPQFSDHHMERLTGEVLREYHHVLPRDDQGVVRCVTRVATTIKRQTNTVAIDDQGIDDLERLLLEYHRMTPKPIGPRCCFAVPLEGEIGQLHFSAQLDVAWQDEHGFSEASWGLRLPDSKATMMRTALSHAGLLAELPGSEIRHYVIALQPHPVAQIIEFNEQVYQETLEEIFYITREIARDRMFEPRGGSCETCAFNYLCKNEKHLVSR